MQILESQNAVRWQPPLVPQKPELLPGMIGQAPAIRTMARLVRRAAALRLPVLIRGESGTGKELVARAVHRASDRGHGPFRAINAGTLDGQLACSTLFGHEAGAFTGAKGARRGAFRVADGGTLFLDEVAALPPAAQTSLLRVLEEGVVLPVGGDAGTTVDVRVVAATCEPIEQMVQRGHFRNDLYQRLSAVVIAVPPLRQRGADVLLIATALLGELGLGELSLTKGAADLLARHDYPGNVRELRNVLTQAALLGDGGQIGYQQVAAALGQRRGGSRLLTPGEAHELVRSEGGNVSRAARMSGMPRSTLRDLLKRPQPDEDECRGGLYARPSLQEPARLGRD